jgi:hypothetical protein
MERLQTNVELLKQSPAIAEQVPVKRHAKLLTQNCGEMAEWLKAAVC